MVSDLANGEDYSFVSEFIVSDSETAPLSLWQKFWNLFRKDKRRPVRIIKKCELIGVSFVQKKA